MPTCSALSGAQPHVWRLITTALAAQRVHHAFVLSCSEINVANSVANTLLESLICLNRQGSDACGSCPSCRQLAAQVHPDVLRLSPNDKQTIPIDAIRALTPELALKPALAARKVVLIEQADRMATAAQNALLKTLEEPPGATCFLATTTRWRALLPTIRSRCQRLALRPTGFHAAWQTLAQAGIAPQLARYLAVLVGPQADQAHACIERGAADIVAQLQVVCAEHHSGAAGSAQARTSAILQMAADLGGQRDQADLALACCEVALRDQLAARHGATTQQLYLTPADAQATTQAAAPPMTGRAVPSALALAAAQVQRYRQKQAFNLNRTLALESLLLTWHDKLAQPAALLPSAAPLQAPPATTR